MRRIAIFAILVISGATFAATATATKPAQTVRIDPRAGLNGAECIITADAFWTGYRPDYVIIGIRNGTTDANRQFNNRVDYTSKVPNGSFTRSVDPSLTSTAYVQLFNKTHAGDVVLASITSSTIDTSNCTTT